MKTMIINGKEVEFLKEKNILEVIRKVGIELPTFCYDPELSLFGSCRMCIVEDKNGKMIPACSVPPKENLEIFTHSKKVLEYRRIILELLIASHNVDCKVCEKNLNCRLQTVCMQLGVKDSRFERIKKNIPVPTDCGVSLVREHEKCILCGKCVRVCAEVQSVRALRFANQGPDMYIASDKGISLDEGNCVRCGQCAAVCPTATISVKNETDRVLEALSDKNKKVIVQMAPAVRVALGEEFGIEPGTNVIGKIVTALRILGFDLVYDTTMGADMTIEEEAREFISRLEKGENLPIFTSCCPSWVIFCKNNYKELSVTNLSTCRSPQAMLGAAIKGYERKLKSDDKREVVSVAIMPCTSKKYEILLEDSFTEGIQDIDIVITTQEIAKMIKEAGINFKELEDSKHDMPLGLGTGAGIIFGVTGGVTEAVLRRSYKEKTNQTLDTISYSGVRGFDGLREASVNIDGKEIKIAVVHGLKNARNLVDAILEGKKDYHIVEVMACPGGCVGGGGQPIKPMFSMDIKKARGDGLYKADEKADLKFTDQNYAMNSVIKDVLEDKREHFFHNPSRH